jgi:hypothetical protein
MAKGMNTGPGNYKAPILGGSAKQVKEALAGVPKLNHPNRKLSTTEYKKTLRKHEESNE